MTVTEPEFTFEQVRDAFLSDKQETKSKNTIEGYTYALRRFEAFLDKYSYTYLDIKRGTDITLDFEPPENASPEQEAEIRAKSATPLDNKTLLDCFIIEMLNVEQYAQSTVRSCFGYLRSFIKYLYKNDKIPIDRNYAKDIELGEYIDYGSTRQQDEIDDDFVAVSPEEFEAMLEHAPAPSTRNRLMMRCMYNCGLRRSEVAALTVDNIKTERNLMIVPSLKSDKRKVWYGDGLRAQLKLWIDVHRESHKLANESDTLFLGPNGALSPKRINKIVQTAAEDAGVQDVLYQDHSGQNRNRLTAHSLRHGYAVQFIENSGGRDGANIYALSKLMGHHSISVTERYLDARDQYLKTQALNYAPDT